MIVCLAHGSTLLSFLDVSVSRRQYFSVKDDGRLEVTNEDCLSVSLTICSLVCINAFALQHAVYCENPSSQRRTVPEFLD